MIARNTRMPRISTTLPSDAKRPRTKARLSLSEAFSLWGLPYGEVEYPCVPGRKFRLDWAAPEFKVGVEQQGGIWMVRGGHNRMGRMRDNEKMNLCQLEGWLILQFTPQEIWGGYATDLIKRALQSRGWKGEPNA